MKTILEKDFKKEVEVKAHAILKNHKAKFEVSFFIAELDEHFFEETQSIDEIMAYILNPSTVFEARF